jgi:hypothetical protein
MRAKELLAGGLDPIQTILCSVGGLSLPVLGCGIENKLRFSVAVSFDDCHDFLVKENYLLADFVTIPGEFSVRGGIIDVFPFSSICPCRINFLDDIPTVFRFNIDSQLTTTGVENFILSSIANNEPLPIKAVSLKRFLHIDFDGSGRLCIGGLSVSQKYLELKTVTHRQFYNMGKAAFKSVSAIDDLSSVGVVDENKNIVVPFWFIERGLPPDKKERV